MSIKSSRHIQINYNVTKEMLKTNGLLKYERLFYHIYTSSVNSYDDGVCKRELALFVASTNRSKHLDCIYNKPKSCIFDSKLCINARCLTLCLYMINFSHDKHQHGCQIKKVSGIQTTLS